MSKLSDPEVLQESVELFEGRRWNGLPVCSPSANCRKPKKSIARLAATYRVEAAPGAVLEIADVALAGEADQPAGNYLPGHDRASIGAARGRSQQSSGDRRDQYRGCQLRAW